MGINLHAGMRLDQTDQSCRRGIMSAVVKFVAGSAYHVPRLTLRHFAHAYNRFACLYRQTLRRPVVRGQGGVDSAYKHGGIML